MKEQMSSKMKRMTQLYRWVIPVILLYVIAVSFSLAGLGLMLFEGTESDQVPQKFYVYDGNDIYSSLKAQMMTYEFASDFKETNHYYFAYDEELLPYIVQIHGELSDECLKVQSYLYDESDAVPEPVMFYGMPAPIGDDIREYAIESYNNMWGEKLVTEDNFSDYFGEYYLDTTRKPISQAADQASLFFTFAFMLLCITTLFLVLNLKSRRFRRGRATLKAWTEDKLLALDQQLAQANTAAYEKEKLYLTRDYIVTNAEGFEIIPYEDIERVYDTLTGTRMHLMAETRDQRYHTLALAKGTGRRNQESFQELVNQVKKRISDKKEEFQESPLSTEYRTSLENGDMEALFQMSAAMDKKQGNRILGIIGALFGALVGAGLWVLMGQIGFIAGIVGFVMLKLALSGYQTLGKAMDKKGAVICLVITAGMILGANFLDYAVSLARAYFQYEASWETLAYVFSNFGSLMSDMDLWRGFFLDLLIGYGLSAWSSANAIRNILSMSNE